jgi:hypothetical protein|tara:strand:- start:380 stop:622 length:243 start_codon:yes stop_codon:yes gene_type:complete
MQEYIIQFEGDFILKGIEGLQLDHKTIVHKFENKRQAYDLAMTIYDECLKGVGVTGYNVFQCRRERQKTMKNFLGERHAD